MGGKPGTGCARPVRAPLVAMLFAAGVAGMGGLAFATTGWLGAPYSITIPAHINGVGQAVSGQTNLTLEYDTACTLSISAAPGDEVLRCGGSSLTTAYKLTGVPGGDTNWVPSSDFLTHTYFLTGSSGGLPITLWVQGTAPANEAPEAGTYTANIAVTVTW